MSTQVPQPLTPEESRDILCQLGWDRTDALFFHCHFTPTECGIVQQAIQAAADANGIDHSDPSRWAATALSDICVEFLKQRKAANNGDSNARSDGMARTAEARDRSERRGVCARTEPVEIPAGTLG